MKGIRKRIWWFGRDMASKLLDIPKKADPAMVAQCQHLLSFDSAQRVAIDDPHAMLIFGLVLSHKPEQVLEIGVGSGFLTQTLLNAVEYNQRGALTCVDNWFDASGEEPKFFEELRSRGARHVFSSEKEFVTSCEAEAFDFILSDGDHFNSGDWIDDTLRILRPGGVVVFHDTNQPEVFPNLGKIVKRVEELGLPHYHFTQKSRKDERTDRGLFLVFKMDTKRTAKTPGS
jgi:predicted O-methyltransferase YrrM